MRTRSVAVASRASSSVQQPAHGQEPHCSVAKDTAHVDVSGRTNCAEFENPNTLLRTYTVPALC